MATPSDENIRQFMIYAPDELVRAVKIAAARRDVTASALVRGILQDWLDAHDAEGSRRSSSPSSVIARQAPG
jgi:hypothetical protein